MPTCVASMNSRNHSRPASQGRTALRVTLSSDMSGCWLAVQLQLDARRGRVVCVLLARLLGPRRFLCPCDSLYRSLLPRISAEHLEWTLADWMRATLVAEADEPIALDGKSIRGARTGEQKAPHLLSFCTHHSQEILRAACAWTRRPMRFPSLSKCCRVCRWLDAFIPPMPCIPRWTSWPWYAPGRVMSC